MPNTTACICHRPDCDCDDYRERTRRHERRVREVGDRGATVAELRRGLRQTIVDLPAVESER